MRWMLSLVVLALACSTASGQTGVAFPIHGGTGVAPAANKPGDWTLTAAGKNQLIKHNLSAAVAPAVGDDSGDGYAAGSRWFDTTAGKVYLCVSPALGAAVWREMAAQDLAARFTSLALSFPTGVQSVWRSDDTTAYVWPLMIQNAADGAERTGFDNQGNLWVFPGSYMTWGAGDSPHLSSAHIKSEMSGLTRTWVQELSSCDLWVMQILDSVSTPGQNVRWLTVANNQDTPTVNMSPLKIGGLAAGLTALGQQGKIEVLADGVNVTSTLDKQLTLAAQAPGVATPFHFLQAAGFDTTFPFDLAGIYDSSYLDQYLIFNATLSGGTRTSPTFTSPAGSRGAYIRFDGGVTRGLDLGSILSDGAGPTSQVFVEQATGNVCIGAKNPNASSKLDVRGQIFGNFLALGSQTVASYLIDAAGDGGGFQQGMRLANTGVLDGDDTEIIFTTQGSRTFSIGLDRSSFCFALTPNSTVVGAAGSVFVNAISGNVGVATNIPGGSGAEGGGVLSIANSTSPVGGVANQISLYSADEAGTAQLFAMNEAGTARHLTYGNTTQAAWTTTGPAFDYPAATHTDTTTLGAGTIAVRTASSFGAPTFASTNAITVTDAYNLYVPKPIAGTNTTIARSNSAYFEGNIGVGERVSVASNLGVGVDAAATGSEAVDRVKIQGNGAFPVSLAVQCGGAYTGYEAKLTTTAADEGFNLTMGGTKIISSYGYYDADEVGLGIKDHANMVYMKGGNVGIKTLTPGGSPTAGIGVLSIGTTSYGPIGGVPNQVSMYSADVASSSELFAMNEAGSTQQLTGAGIVMTKVVSFVENATNTTHTGTVPIPAGSVVESIKVVNTVLWGATSATLVVGDGFDADGYFTGIDCKATDLLVGEVLDINSSASWGGKEGAYLNSTTGRRGNVQTGNSGIYYGVADNIVGVMTVGTPAATTGRTFMTVTYSTPQVIAAVATGP